MVVVCESCSTRFRIDDARIPAKGRLVRCSQCKATFIAKPESASLEETVQERVEEVTQADGLPVPEPAADLFDVGGEDLSDRSETRAAPSSDDERWEFDETPRTTAPPVPAAPKDEELEDTVEPVGPAPLEEVGDPAEWDLLRGSERAAQEARFVEPEPPPPQATPKQKPQPAPVQQAESTPAVAEPRRPERAAAGSTLAQLGRLGLSTAAWFALAVLVGLGVAPLFARSGGLHAVRLLPKSFALADGEAHGVQASFVENAFAGSLLVIRGELSRTPAQPGLGLRVYLVAADGSRLGDGRWAGVARTPDELRLLAPERLLPEIEASAATAARGGSFVAFFELPTEAADFVLALEPLSVAAAQPAASTEAAAATGEPATGPAADATASSSSTPRPSSE